VIGEHGFIATLHALWLNLMALVRRHRAAPPLPLPASLRNGAPGLGRFGRLTLHNSSPVSICTAPCWALSVSALRSLLVVQPRCGSSSSGSAQVSSRVATKARMQYSWYGKAWECTGQRDHCSPASHPLGGGRSRRESTRTANTKSAGWDPPYPHLKPSAK
jgi:hypothetical protein